MNLPIDLIPNTNPPRFKWQQVIASPIGNRTIEHEGLLMPAIEGAVASLIKITNQLIADNLQIAAELHLIKEAQKAHATAQVPLKKKQ